MAAWWRASVSVNLRQPLEHRNILTAALPNAWRAIAPALLLLLATALTAHCSTRV
jgi:hypothetical protein